MQQFRSSGEVGGGGGKATKQLEQIYVKYRSLLDDMNGADLLLTSKGENTKLRRGLRKNVERFKTIKRGRKTKLRLLQFGSALFDVVETNRRDLFTCPLCREILTVPVTIECGHTFCYNCAIRLNSKCCECSMDFGNPCCTNVLVQDVINKCTESQRDIIIGQDNGFSDARDLLDLEPRYCLRSRYAGLKCRSGIDENNIDKIFRRYFRSSRRTNQSTTVGRRKFSDERIFTSERDEEEWQQFDRLKYIINGFFTNMDCIREQTLKATWNHMNASDLECILCSRCYLDPVTTACGHTFCRGCLARVLDHGLACPLCMTKLSPLEQSRGTTYCLDQAIKLLFPREYEERFLNNCEEFQVLEKNCQVPVFVCTNAFPGVACPLYVYEPRYRLLTRRCLQSTSRRFAMAAKNDSNERFSSYGTILEVKDAVLLQDGRSILTTVGVRRFKVLEKGEEDGYDTAKVQYIRDNVVSSERLPELLTLHQRVYSKAARWVRSLRPRVLAEVESSIGQMPSLENDWITLPDGPAWAWWLMPILPLSSQLQVGFLSTTSLEKRLRAIDKLLEHIKIRMKALERNNPVTCATTDDSSDSCRLTWLL